jgi:lipoprotein-anchoring transpeptidase ErfK/SrfK
MLDQVGASPPRARQARLAVAVVLLAVLAVPVAVVGWARLSEPEATGAAGRFDPNVIRTVAQPLPTSTTLPAPIAPVTTVAPAPAPVLPELISVPGSRLRRGVARPIVAPAMVADVKGATIGLHSAPGQALADESADNPTWEGLPLVFLVQQVQGDWLEVQLNSRPNQTTAWVRASEVTIRQVKHRIVVNLASRSLTVYDGTTPVMEAEVAIGTPSTPTPRGNYYVDGAVRTPDPSGVYGPFQVSVAAFSEVLMSFGTGVGQIALHGTNAPGLIGTAASNGCLRMNNADITRLANTVEIGAPVQIV